MPAAPAPAVAAAASEEDEAAKMAARAKRLGFQLQVVGAWELGRRSRFVRVCWFVCLMVCWLVGLFVCLIV